MTAPPSQRALPSQILLLLATIQICQAAIAAWMTPLGPQLMLQNTTTGQIRYSYCNSSGSPIYSYDDATTYFDLTYPPKNGTSLAGIGWWTPNNTVASIFYVDTEGRIANALVNCHMGNGTFGSQGNWIISNTSHPVGNETGLAALALGTSTDYRVYYHDNQRAINQLISSGDSGWLWDGYISQDVTSSPAIHAAFTEKNVTLIAPRDSKNMEISRWNTDNSWHITAAPYPLNGNIVTETTSRSDISINSSASTGFTLPGWDGATKSIGISIDSTHSRYVWYIGTDRSLHEIGSFNFIWQGVSSQSSQFWPQADTPNAELAVTSDFSSSSVYIYYFVNQSLAEIKRVNNGWVPTAALATVDPASAATSTNTNTSAATDLSTGSKIGIGVGISASAIAVGGIAVLFLYSGRKAARRANMEKAEGTSRQASEYPSQSSPSKHELPAYKYQRAWHPASFSAPPHTALDAAPRPIVYELLAQPLIQELEGSEYPSPIPSRASPESGN